MPSILQAIVAILFMALIFFLAWYIPKTIVRTNLMGMKTRNLEVIEKLQISKDQAILLVKMFDKVMVVGVTQGSMTVLGGVDAARVSVGQSGAPEGQSFAKVLRQVIASHFPGELPGVNSDAGANSDAGVNSDAGAGKGGSGREKEGR